MKNNSQNKSYDESFEKMLLNKIEKSPIANPDNQYIDLTIHTLEQYLPTQTNNLDLGKHLSLLIELNKNISLVSPFYWFTSLFIYLLGFVLTLYSKNPTTTIIFFSPIPFILMFFEDIKGRESEILEMELACKYSPQVIMLSRFVVIIFYNIITMTLIAALLHYYVIDGLFFNIIIAWLTPLTLLGNITLVFIKKLKTSYTLSVVILLWMSLMAWLINTPQVIEALLNLNMAFYSVIILIGILLLTLQIKDYINKISERSMLFES